MNDTYHILRATVRTSRGIPTNSGIVQFTCNVGLVWFEWLLRLHFWLDGKRSPSIHILCLFD